MIESCIFCKIVADEMPKHLIAEDDRTLAILTIDPYSEGHTLVIPKKHSDYLWEAEPEDYTAVHNMAKKIAESLQEQFKTELVVSAVDGTEVKHTHLHLIPTNTSLVRLVKEHSPSEPDHQKLADTASKIRSEL